jgi:hypothetical protein
MLPPIPPPLAPVTAQQEVLKARPDIPPVAPVSASAKESEVRLDKRHPQEAEELLRQEQRRRQQQQRQGGYSAEQLAEGEVAAEDQQLLEELPRQGLWVDVEV